MHQRGMDRAAVHERPELLEHVGEGGTLARAPESHRPLFEVVVWLMLPPFVHVTFVPFATVIVLGWKAKLMILTRLT